MWFGGTNGLARYDGYTTKLYRHDAQNRRSLSNNLIRDLVIGAEGHLWVATMDGLNRYDRDSDSFTHFYHDPKDPDSISSSDISSVLLDRSGDLWLGTVDGGLNRLISSSNERARFERHILPTYQFRPGDIDIRSISEDASGHIWAGTWGAGAYEFDPKSQRYKHHYHQPGNPNSISHNEVVSFSTDSRGAMWIGTLGGGLDRYHPESGFTHFIYDENDPSSIGSNIIWDIWEDQTGHLWVATDGGGLNVLNLDEGKRFQRYRNQLGDESSVLSDKLFAIYEDSTAGLWFGHFPSGVSRLDPYASAFRNYRHDPNDANSLSHSAILAVVEDLEGDLWVGTENGLNHLDRDNNIITRYTKDAKGDKHLDADAVLSVLADHKGDIWVGGWGGGLSRLDRGTGVFHYYRPDASKKNALHDDRIWSLFEDSKKQVWIGTERGGFYRYNRAEDNFHRFGQVGTYVWMFFEDSLGKFWVGGYDGLNLFNRDTGHVKRFRHTPTDPYSISGNLVRSMLEDEHGGLWIPTEGGGLNHMERSTAVFTAYREQDGLAADGVIGILEDDQGYLWLSTGKGLSRFNPETKEFRNYSKGHGLPGNLYNRAAYLKTSKGEMAFGSTDGLSLFFPQNLPENTRVPPVVFTDFQLLNKAVPIGAENSPLQISITQAKSIILSHKDSIFTLEFAALNYLVPEDNQYAYKMEGFDKSWYYVGGRRSATYTNLDPGEYVFRVKASNNEGVWNEEGASIKITVLPPWWQTHWAYAVYAFFAICMLGLLFYLYSHRKEVVRERTLNQRLLQLDKDKDAFLANTSHELRTPLNGIIGLSESLIDGVTGPLSEATRENVELIVSSGKRLSNLVNDILDFASLKENRLVLNKQLVDVYNLIEIVVTLLQPLTKDRPVTVVNETPKGLDWVLADESRLQQVLYNLVGNAIKFTPEGSVTIGAWVEKSEKSNEGFLWVSITDTGIGIAKDQQLKVFNAFEQVDGSASSYSGTGLGLAVSHQLIAQHGGTITLDSTLGLGSRFGFSIPLATGDAALEYAKSVRQRDLIRQVGELGFDS